MVDITEGFIDFGGYLGRGNIRVSVSGLKRTIVYMNKVMANLPKTSIKIRNDFADDVVTYARINLSSRSRYIGRDTKLERHRKGLLHDSITVLQKASTKNKKKAVIGIEPSSYAVNYAKAVEEGSRARAIRPQGHKALKFQGTNEFSGKYVLTRRVHRGPSRPMYFMRDAVQESANNMRAKIDKDIRNLLKKR